MPDRIKQLAVEPPAKPGDLTTLYLVTEEGRLFCTMLPVPEGVDDPWYELKVPAALRPASVGGAPSPTQGDGGAAG